MSARPTLPIAEPRRKENQFINKRGRKHHNYPPGKAPYPISYDRDILDGWAPVVLIPRIHNVTPSLAVTPRITTCGETFSTAGRR